uniref:Uncharacterized protein n=1 Tax=Grammatophora oceanica TaxID=210454 RepID=A0A7S1YKI9_9STRA|mmetsp:Transcript_5720/g.8091  ORF Transcript_5720/g.8091 Transcript_5720/m.8091 type:complete len:266 (+) Transcript_5720:80-877(+)
MSVAGSSTSFLGMSMHGSMHGSVSCCSVVVGDGEQQQLPRCCPIGHALEQGLKLQTRQRQLKKKLGISLPLRKIDIKCDGCSLSIVSKTIGGCCQECDVDLCQQCFTGCSSTEEADEQQQQHQQYDERSLMDSTRHSICSFSSVSCGGTTRKQDDATVATSVESFASEFDLLETVDLGDRLDSTSAAHQHAAGELPVSLLFEESQGDRRFSSCSHLAAKFDEVTAMFDDDEEEEADFDCRRLPGSVQAMRSLTIAARRSAAARGA